VFKEAICLMTTVKLMLACKQVQECNQIMLQLSLLKTLGLKDQIETASKKSGFSFIHLSPNKKRVL